MNTVRVEIFLSFLAWLDFSRRVVRLLRFRGALGYRAGSEVERLEFVDALLMTLERRLYLSR